MGKDKDTRSRKKQVIRAIVFMVLALVIFGGIGTVGGFCLLAWQEMTRKLVREPQVVLPLPGELSPEPMFNSNNPEEVRSEGILLSTLKPDGKATPEAHLDFAFTGKFGIFSHHVVKPAERFDRRTLYEGLLLHNPGKEVAHVVVTGGASSLMEPDSPYDDGQSMVANPTGTVHSGPGSRAADEVVRGMCPAKALVKKEVSIPPGATLVLAKMPIPIRDLSSPCNKRSTLLYLTVDKGSVQVADVAAWADFDSQNKVDVVPSDERFLALLNEGKRAGPPEPPATAPGAKGSKFAYGRVGGVSQGTHWRNLPPPDTESMDIKDPGEQFSFVVSSLKFGTFGTGQDQTAPMLVRYPDSAYRAHGNYGLYYDVSFNLKNPTKDKARDVDVLFQTPLKSDKAEDCLTFTDPPHVLVFYRGTVCITYVDQQGKARTEYFHIIQRRGERGTKLATIHIAPGKSQSVRLQLVYAADATPPQVITFKTRM